MLKFQSISIKDKLRIDSFFAASQEVSCEANFVTLFIWQSVYGTEVAFDADCMIIRMKGKTVPAYSLPYGNFERGMELIFAETSKPRFWIQEGERYDKFIALYGERYEIKESRDAFDYLYLRTDLAELSGKKYQSKRNHISAFSRANDWRFEPISDENIADVKCCAERWYAENNADADKYLSAEREGVWQLLDNLTALAVKGGAIFVGDTVVAFTLGTPISSQAFDIHIEKALAEYATAYAVINREFARYLEGYEYLNREDDMGLEGLRKAKLSYKPHRLIRKFRCDIRFAKRTECFELYRAAFGDSGEFDRRLFDYYFDCCSYLEVNGEVASMLFKLPCVLNIDGKRYPCSYIYAAATAEKYRSQGLMTKLLEMQEGILILKPASESLISFYSVRGFKPFHAFHAKNGARCVEADERLGSLAAGGNTDGTPFTVMIKSDEPIDCENLNFAYTME